MDKEFSDLQTRIEPLERFIKTYSATLPQPLFYDSAQNHTGFRYGNPNFRHFCLLKGMRIVSALNACICLVRAGYVQELYVLLRTVVEYKSHIEFVLYALDSDLNLRADVERHVKVYFEDFQRNSSDDYKRPQLKQGAVHKIIGTTMRQNTQKGPDSKKFANVFPEKLLSNIYLNFSNYVHARYPEVMDMYGGSPLQIHLRGMSHTPKDWEMFQMVEATIESASLLFKLWIKKMNLRNITVGDSVLEDWYSASFE